MSNLHPIPELLSPAGNREKLEAAINFGADAVYLAGTSFGMRSACDNFTIDELYSSVAYAHERGKRVYVTVNTMPRTSEYPALREYIAQLGDISPDAVIVSDLGVMAEVRRIAPKLQIHMSTQASAVSAAVCREYHKLGASRVILARELTLDEIRDIRAGVSDELELETFVHGSMCVSWSGMCLLSAHLADRDANKGNCTQPCRWNWRLNTPKTISVCQDYDPVAAQNAAGTGIYDMEEAKHVGERYVIEEDEFGSFVMSARDMKMIAHLDDLRDAGIASLKIEGRVKSAYYTAVTANAYRIGLDRLAAGLPFDERLHRELDSVSHREYGEGWFYGRPQLCTAAGYIREKAYLATALTDVAPGEPALFIQRNKIVTGETAELLTPGCYGKPFTVGELRDEDGAVIESAPHPAMRFTLALPYAVKTGDILRGGN
ncbi:MAG: U32 family peptidase [Clostridiales bacterium]|nr:U32 family peptidase [Clostridiales bacterium]